MKLILTIIATSLFAAVSAQARMGYTLEQCIAQYGQPTFGYDTEDHTYKHATEDDLKNVALGIVRENGESWKAYIFQVEGLRIYVSFYQGLVSNIAYQPGDNLSLAQARTILDKNGTAWKKDKANSDGEGDAYIGTAANQHKLHVSLNLGTSGDFLKYDKNGDIVRDHNTIENLIITDETANAQLRAARDVEEKQTTDTKEKAQQEKQQRGLDKL
jgi:hypothetical protein